MHYKKLRISCNITDGGDGMLGYRHSEEVLVKLRKSLKGRKSPNKGKCMKESTKIKLSIINKGKTLPSKITECCRGIRNKTLNNKWRYKYG